MRGSWSGVEAQDWHFGASKVGTWASKVATSHSTLSSLTVWVPLAKLHSSCPTLIHESKIYRIIGSYFVQHLKGESWHSIVGSQSSLKGKSMSKVRPSSMYSKSEETEEENTQENEEEGSAVDFILTFVSLILILITLPFSIWKCVKVVKVGYLIVETDLCCVSKFFKASSNVFHRLHRSMRGWWYLDLAEFKRAESSITFKKMDYGWMNSGSLKNAW